MEDIDIITTSYPLEYILTTLYGDHSDISSIYPDGIDTYTYKLNDKALMIIEQMPGMVEINDATDYLKFGYWPSYNVPFGKNISENANITNTMNGRVDRVPSKKIKNSKSS